MDFSLGAVTFLSILASNSIAVPLASTFPTSELRYILNNSETLILLSSTKFQNKAREIIKTGVEKVPVLALVEKRLNGGNGPGEVKLEIAKESAGGIMLYTSGTTSRPVSYPQAL